LGKRKKRKAAGRRNALSAKQKLRTRQLLTLPHATLREKLLADKLRCYVLRCYVVENGRLQARLAASVREGVDRGQA